MELPVEFAKMLGCDPEMMAHFEGIPHDEQQKIIERAAAAGSYAEMRRIGREIRWH